MRSFSVHLVHEAAALFEGIDQFAEAVGEFHAADIKLEAFGHARIVRRWRGQGRPRSAGYS